MNQSNKEYITDSIKRCLMSLGFVFWVALPCLSIFYALGLMR